MEEIYGSIFVLYHPTDEQIKNVKENASLVDFICIVDNSPTEYSKYFMNINNVKYIHNKNIGGIAGAFNRGFDFLISKSCKKIFTFDQDSIVPQDYFIKMLTFSKENNAAIVCPNFFDINAKTYGSFVKLTKFWYENTNDNTTHFCISSGMMIDESIYRKLNGFNEQLIIDHVDTDFALKALDNNISIYYVKDIILEHQIGNRRKHKFLGITLKPNHHNKLRRYFIARNGTYLALKYFSKYRGYFFLNVNRIIHELLCITLYEDEKLAKIFNIFKGIKDSFFLYRSDRL